MQIDELYNRLMMMNLPKSCVLGGFKILDVPKFIESNYLTIKGQQSNPKRARYLPYYNRLKSLHDEFQDKK